ncbi:MAG: hypothetical protein ACK5HT_22370, partial [Draconibacterium sp.]
MIIKNYLKNKREKIKNGLRFTVGILFIIFFIACSKDDEIKEGYENPLENENTYSNYCQQLIDQTNLIGKVYSDTVYTLVDGYEVAEIYYKTTTNYAMHIFIAQIDLNTPGLTISTLTPNDGEAFLRQKITEQALHKDVEDRKVWGGINGDYFNLDTGIPGGIVHKDGIAIKTEFTDTRFRVYWFG